MSDVKTASSFDEIEVHFKIVDSPTLVKAAEAEQAAMKAGRDPGENVGAIERLEQARREYREMEKRLVFRIPAGSGTPKPFQGKE